MGKKGKRILCFKCRNFILVGAHPHNPHVSKGYCQYCKKLVYFDMAGNPFR